MNQPFKTAKGAMALALAVTLFGTTAYAADTKTTQTTVTTETEQAENVLQFQTALDKAYQEAASLRDLAAMNDYLQETKEDLWDAVGSFGLPSYEYQTWVNSAVYAYSTGAYSTTSNMTKNKYNESIAKLSIEATLRNYFTTILTNEAQLELTKATAETQKLAYKQGQVKHDLGLLSKYELDKLKTDSEQAALQVSQMEMSLEKSYINLNSMIGESTEKRYTLEYPVTYEPFTLNGQPLETYIDARLKNDYSLLIAEQSMEDAKFNQNFLSEDVTNATRKSNDLSYDNAKRNYKTAKDSKKLAMENAYNQLQQAESSIVSTKANITKAQADLKTAEVNYQAGNTTKMTVEQAKLAVTKAELALEQLIYNYDMLVFSFKNPSILGGGSSGGAQE